MWKSWKQGIALATLATAVGLWCSSASPGKGPRGDTPAGTIYFRHIDTIWSIWSMKADGSNRIQFPNVEIGEPSYLRQGTANERWFVRTDSELDEQRYFPDVQPLSYVWAISETGQTVPLVTRNDLAILTTARWTPGETLDDGSVSFIAEKWGLGTDGLPMAGSVTEAGLYVVDVDFADGTVVPSPPRLVVDLKSELYVDETGMPTRVDDGGQLVVGGSVAGHSWAPGQTAFAFGMHINYADGFPEGTNIQEIWIVDLTKVPSPPVVPSAALKLLASGNGIGGPEWSPDGSRIAYNGWDGKVFHQLSTGRTKILRDNPFYGWGPTKWSPDGKYFVTHRWDKARLQTDGIYRFAADLTGQTLLTAGFVPPGEYQYQSPVGWRD